MIYKVVSFNILLFMLIVSCQQGNKKDENNGNTLVRLKESHHSSECVVALSHDFIYSGYNDGVVLKWDRVDGRFISAIKAHKTSVTSITVSFNDSFFVSVGENEGFKIWNIDNEELIWQSDSKNQMITSVCVTKNCEYILSSARDGMIRLWDVSTGAVVRSFEGHIGSVNSLSITPDDKYMLSGGDDSSIRLWGIGNGEELRQYNFNKSAILSLDISPDGKTAVSVAIDSTVYKFGIFEEPTTILLYEDDSMPLIKIRFISNESIILLAEWGMYKYTPELNWRRFYRIEDDYDVRDLFSMDVSRDCKYIVTGYTGLIIDLWDISSGDTIYSIPRIPRVRRPYFDLSLDDRFVAINCDRYLNIFDFESCSMNQLKNVDMIDLIEFTKDSKRIIQVTQPDSDNYAIMIYDLCLNLLASCSHVGIAEPNTLDHIANSSVFVSSCLNYKDNISFWDFSRNDIVLKRSLTVAGGGVASFDLNNDGTRLVSYGADDVIRLWNVKDDSEEADFLVNDGAYNEILLLESDGKVLTTNENGGVSLWGLQNRNVEMTFSMQNETVRAFSVDAKCEHIILGGNSGSVTYCELKTGKIIWSSSAQLGPIIKVSISSNGKFAVSLDLEGVLIIYDIIKGNTLCSIKTFYDGNWVCLTPEGYYVSSTEGDKYIVASKDKKSILSLEEMRIRFNKPNHVKKSLDVLFD